MDGVAAAAAPPGLAHPALPAEAALPMPVQSLRDAPPPNIEGRGVEGGGVEGVIVGRALYDGRVLVREALAMLKT